MARPKLTLFVDTVSPFAYLAYRILRVCLPPSFPSTSHSRVL